LNQAEPLAAKEKNPESEKAKLNKLRGSAYYRMGQYSQAADNLTDALRVNQSDWADFSMLGISYFQLNRLDEAIQALEKALSMNPGEKVITDALGNAYLKKGTIALSGKQYPVVVQALLKAKGYLPRNGYISYNLAEAYLFQKRFADAEKSLNEAVSLLPNNSGVYTRMGLVCEKQKKWDLALKAYKKANDLNPSKELKEAIARINENMK
jgi:tetratricopeptide (TPR) repeat protein